ncbi:guanine nucleotide-binding protein G(f) subunit alpha [Diabrotica virgifera virgifera]|uniref:Guanine nucleotide-binding protein G(s) subunit alpha n=1 Tax=Diabrotica virgifera virgifera TaxID=50390 RepID=A0A6P7F8G0_DIAVI|nr:guanine nucleotide-binding protein G(f) subunit alpha [Diabrotica virgifera virgifera]
MGCGSKVKEDRDHELYTKKFLQTVKLLLLGTGESGKTTIIKQMKILHINGYSNDERREKIPFIKQNIHESIFDIVSNMSRINPPVEAQSEESKASIEYILNLGPGCPSEFTEEYIHHVKTAWADAGVQKTFNRSNEYQLIDSAEHFLNQVDVVCKPDYIPTNQDILFCRIMTVSISKIEFDMPVPKQYGGGKAEFWMFDVGGQRGERKKWIKVFAGIQGILFLIAASDFDLMLREDTSVNRLEESFRLFQDIYSSEYVEKVAMIVFLNKQDLLQRKIEQGRKLAKYFPEYSHFNVSDTSEYEKAKLFMKQKLLGIAQTPVNVEKSVKRGKNITERIAPRDTYIHYTIATDTNNIKRVFDSVHESILRTTVQEVGLI